jgi:hypothetical protein
MALNAFLSILLAGAIVDMGSSPSQRTGRVTTATSKGTTGSKPAHIQQTPPFKNSNKDSNKPKESKQSANSGYAAMAPLDNSKAALEAIEVERITGLEKDGLQAELKKDRSWFQDYLADDLTRVTPDGVVEDKVRSTASTLDPANKVESKIYDELTVRPYGEDVIIATGKVSVKGKRNNAEYTEQRTFTHVWVNRIGQWQEVAIQESPIPPSNATSDSATSSATRMQKPPAAPPAPSESSAGNSKTNPKTSPAP